jgi:hypothetical protein
VKLALVYPERAKWPKWAWVADAARALGHDVRRVSTAIELREADRWADLVLFEHKNAGLNIADILAVARLRKSRWVQWWFDLLATDAAQPLAEQGLVKAFLPVMRAMDRVLVKERGLLTEYKALGVNAAYLDQGCPSAMRACAHRERPEFDVVIWGTAGSDYRQRMADVRALVKRGFSTAWAGHPSGSLPRGVVPVPFFPALDLPKLASRAAVVLCVDRRHDLESYWSDRLWLALGMGACVVRRNTPGLAPETPLYGYQDAAELVEVVGRLKADPEARRAIGEAARRYTLSGHTYEHRLRELLNHVQG